MAAQPIVGGYNKWSWCSYRWVCVMAAVPTTFITSVVQNYLWWEGLLYYLHHLCKTIYDKKDSFTTFVTFAKLFMIRRTPLLPSSPLMCTTIYDKKNSFTTFVTFAKLFMIRRPPLLPSSPLMCTTIYDKKDSFTTFITFAKLFMIRTPLLPSSPLQNYLW
jgi:hypothetical protein